MAAFVLGNGQSRADISVDRLMLLGRLYGCNALYRTHTPTALVATDRAIAQKIQESGYAHKHRFYTRRPINNLGALSVPKKYFGFSSGPIAMSIAAEDLNTPVYLLGFDMGPSTIGKFNNVYADTEFYKKTESLPTFTGNWIKQMAQVMQDYKNTKFIRVHGDTTVDIAEFEPLHNFAKLPLLEFVHRINTAKDL
jgi:hypothetical protein